MAQQLIFVCDHCGHTIDAWSDGNPYYFDAYGIKHYAYHPNHDLLDLCVGNDVPHICLDCGTEFNIDSRWPIDTCPKCDSRNLTDTYQLKGKRCPACQKGSFRCKPGAIS